MHEEQSVIDGRRLAQNYGRRTVFRDLDVAVGMGVTALLGPNGAGKTTLLSTLTGLLPVRGGTLQLFGIDLASRHGRRAVATRLGFLPQTVGYYPNYTLRDFVSYAAWLKAVPQRQLANKVAVSLDLVGLADRADSKMKTLSGGMLRRAGIAQAVVHSPDLLVLDEPAAGLDPEQRIELRRLVRTLGQSCAVLVSTHVVEDVRVVADRVLVLNNGSIAFDGTTTELAALDGSTPEQGDTELERGYLAVLRRSERIQARR